MNTNTSSQSVAQSINQSINNPSTNQPTNEITMWHGQIFNYKLLTKRLTKDYILLEYDAAVRGNWVLKF